MTVATTVEVIRRTAAALLVVDNEGTEAEVGRLEAQLIIERSATNAAVAEVGRLRLLLLEAAVRLERRGADPRVVARLKDEAGL